MHGKPFPVWGSHNNMIDYDICDMSCNSNHIKVIMAKVVYNTILVALSLFVIENNIYRCGCYGSIVQ